MQWSADSFICLDTRIGDALLGVMMKRLALLSLLLATPALGQQPPQPPEQQAWQIMYSREVIAHHVDLASVLKQQAQIEALTKEVADLKAKLPAEPGKP